MVDNIEYLNKLTGEFCTLDDYSLLLEAAKNEPFYLYYDTESGEDFAICEKYEDTFDSFQDLLNTIIGITSW